MRFILAITLTAILAAIGAYLFSWWMIAVAAFLVMLIIRLSAGRGFMAGFLGIALYWLILILIKDSANEHILSIRMAGLFGLPNGFLFITINVFLGALIGGMSGWTGVLVRKIFRKEP